MSSNATTNVTAIDSKKPLTKQELITANIKLLIEQLDAGKSDALTNYLTAMSRFHNYSFGNVLEIARQMPTASPVLPRNKYAAIRDDRPKSKDDAKRPEFKECKFTTEAIITEGSDVGTIHKVCANLSCPVHHPKQTSNRDDAQWKAEQEKQRRDQAIANATGLRVLSAIAAAVPVRLLRRDLFFVLEKLVSVLDESRIETLARQHAIRQKRDEGGIAKTLLAFIRRADEGTLSRLMVEATILLAASRQNGTTVLKDAATLYKVDTEAIGQKVKQEFAATAKAKKEAKPEAKPLAKAKKAA
jgi:ParB family chromosome partitioning protein